MEEDCLKDDSRDVPHARRCCGSLRKVAPLLGYSGHQLLIRAYIGQGLRVDLERFESETVSALVASLKRRGFSDEVINEALDEVVHAESS